MKFLALDTCKTPKFIKTQFVSSLSAAYTDEGYVCTASSTVIASVFTTVFFNVGLVAGFIFFYRTKKREWQKLSGFGGGGGGDSPTFHTGGGGGGGGSRGDIFSPEVLFRSVYDRLPPRPSFSTLQNTISSRHEKNNAASPELLP